MIGIDTLTNVPTRPTASIRLLYDTEEELICCSVIEQGQSNAAAIFDGNRFQFPFGGDKWVDFSHIRGVSNEVEALCLFVLQRSDCFCPRQAFSDLPKAMQSTFWANLLAEMQRLHPVVSVMVM